MKLITFQSFEALKDLINKGYLETNPNYIDLKKSKVIYSWVIEKMNKVVQNPKQTKYPIWAWVKCYNGICPPRYKGTPVKGFDVKITFHKPKKEVFITDFRRYSFVLNNLYIPKTLLDKKKFDKKLQNYKITKEELKAFTRPDKYETHRTDKEYLTIVAEIKKSFDLCITEESDILQGCVWRINLEEIETIEILENKEYCYGSLNYIRKNGKRMNWQEDFYKKLK